MAETNTDAKSERSTSLSRRKMNQDELLLVQETKSAVSRSAHRGADKSAIFGSIEDVGTGPTYSKMQASQKDDNSRLLPMPLKELSLMHVKFQPGSRAEDMWQNVSSVVDELANVDPIVDKKLMRLVGNYYQAGNYCEFLVGLYKTPQNPVVDFKRLCGDGFVMDAFYRQVRDGLRARKVIVEDPLVQDDMADDDVFDCYSSDEEDAAEQPVAPKEDPDDKYLHPNGFLQLSYDENLVSMWIEKIRTRHIEDKNHMMGLMAHNASHPENLQIIIRKGGEDLVKLCRTILESENNSAAVPLLRNTSALVMLLAEHTNLWTQDCVDAMFEAMTFWVPGNNGRKEEAKTGAFEVTESRETVRNLVQTLYLMKAQVDSDALEQSMANQPESRRAALETYLESQKETQAVQFARSIFPQD